MKDDLSIQKREMKQRKISLIKEYDNSEAVNSFALNGEGMWLDKATRVGLVNSTQIAKEAGAKSIVLWVKDKSYVISCDVLLQMLSALELYAMECYNVTAQHMANVNALEDLNRIYNYNYTKGYPARLNFNI